MYATTSDECACRITRLGVKRSLERRSCAGRPASRQGCRSPMAVVAACAVVFLWRLRERSCQRRAGALAHSSTRRARTVAPHLDTEVGRDRFLSAQVWWTSEHKARTGFIAGCRVRRRRCMAQLTGRLRDKLWSGGLHRFRKQHSWQAHALMAIDVAGVDREHRCDRLGDGEPLACERLAPHTLCQRVRPAGRDLLARSWRMANGWQTG